MNKKKIIITLLLIIFTFTFIISLYHILVYINEEKRISKQLNVINDNVYIDEVSDVDLSNIEVIDQAIEVPKANPYWDYIKMNLIDVDFNKLKETNSDVKGWIQVNGTNINYPFVQTSNNDFYLKHSFDKTNNSAGWIFLDYRNDLSSFSDKNTIIYGHGRLDKTMFGSLKNSLTNGWLDNPNNYVVKLSTEYENTLWQVFSVYHIPTTNDYIRVNFSSDEDYLEFINTLLNRSTFDFNTHVNITDRILTLSTCYNDQEKMVLHAKLIKTEKKTNE